MLQPNGLALSTTSCPICPMPIMPSVLPKSSKTPYVAISSCAQTLALVFSCCIISFFSSARAAMMVCSATPIAFAPATFATGTPARAAASTSMC